MDDLKQVAALSASQPGSAQGELPAYVHASAKFIETRLDKAPCDRQAVSDCVRCNALVLARHLLAAAPTPQPESVRNEAFNLGDTIMALVADGRGDMEDRIREAIRDSLFNSAGPTPQPEGAGGEAVAMLVSVAKAAHRAMDDGETLADGRTMLEASGTSELNHALDAMDALPDIPDPGCVYDGWARAEYFARTATPTDAARARDAAPDWNAIGREVVLPPAEAIGRAFIESISGREVGYSERRLLDRAAALAAVERRKPAPGSLEVG